MVTTIRTHPEQFKEFHELLTKDRPDYKPWYFPVNRWNKDPDGMAISYYAPLKPHCCENAEWEGNICSECIKKNNKNPTKKGGWKNPWAQLTFEQAYKRLCAGLNVGISARENDNLVIMDIDNYNLLSQMPFTLTTKSRKRCGMHGFAFTEDKLCKQNIPTNDDGELRSCDQYVVACGSYCETTKNDILKENISEELKQEIINDSLLGVYTLQNKINPINITFKDLPEIYRDAYENNNRAAEMQRINEENRINNSWNNSIKEYEKDSKYGALFKLSINDVAPGHVRINFPHPLHGSDTGKNFTNNGTLAHCWRHLVSINAIQYLCIESGQYDCPDAGTPHHGGGVSKIKGDKNAWECARVQAVKRGLIPEYIPQKREVQEIIVDEVPVKYSYTKMSPGEILVLTECIKFEQDYTTIDNKLFDLSNAWKSYDRITKELEIMKIKNVLKEKKDNKEFKEKKSVIDPNKEIIYLPEDGITISDFAKNLSKHFIGDTIILYKPAEGDVVEIVEYVDLLLKQKIVGFRKVEPKRLLNIIEQKVNTGIATKNGDKIRSANEQLIKIVTENTDFINALYPVNRFLTFPLPFLNDEGELLMPNRGYDMRFQAYFKEDMPKVTELDLEEAKNIIENIFSGFCFQNDIDKTMAIAYMITPFCRGLYHRATNRTPLFIIKANRERAGKDYLAGVIGILYEGRAIDDSPFCTGEKNANNNEELRKKITSAIKQGRRRIHSSNNRGHLSNAILEQFLTSEVWRDRELGKNKELEMNNEMDVSLSANIGITYTPDLWFRARPINLFYYEEDPNNRKFEIPDLWGYVQKNRGLILSAIYTLIKKWYDAGMPPGKSLFTSFPEWARVVGGIMYLHNLGDPCIKADDDAVGGDKETTDMKKLYTIFGNYALANMLLKVSKTVSEMRLEIINIQESNNYMEIFEDMDLTKKDGQTLFGYLIRKYVGRELTCHLDDDKEHKIKLIVNPNFKGKNSRRIDYIFKFID